MIKFVAGTSKGPMLGLGLSAHFFSELPGLDALLVASGPLCAWFGEIPALRGRPPAQRTLARVLFCAVPVGIAVTRAILAFNAGSAGPDEYDY